MGRNMFSPLRGPWANEDWKGWWGDNPPFKHPVFVLTHHPRPTLEFENGTSFHFVDGSPEQVLEQAQAAAGGKDVKVNGGVSTVRAFWKARLLDELHLVMAPVFVGEGERLLGGLGVEEDYQVAGFEASEAAVHYRIVKKTLEACISEEGKDMSVKRMDNVLIVVDDLEAVKAFFIELGLKLEGETTVEGPAVGRLIGLGDVRATLAMMRTPDGQGIELDKFHTPDAVRFGPWTRR